MKPIEHILLGALREVHDELRQMRTLIEEMDRRVTELLREKEDGP